MKQPIVGYHRDDESHWVAELACGFGLEMSEIPAPVLRAAAAPRR